MFESLRAHQQTRGLVAKWLLTLFAFQVPPLPLGCRCAARLKQLLARPMRSRSAQAAGQLSIPPLQRTAAIVSAARLRLMQSMRLRATSAPATELACSKEPIAGRLQPPLRPGPCTGYGTPSPPVEVDSRGGRRQTPSNPAIAGYRRASPWLSCTHPWSRFGVHRRKGPHRKFAGNFWVTPHGWRSGDACAQAGAHAGTTCTRL